MIYYHARAHSRRGAGCPAKAALRGGMSWRLGGLATGPFCAPRALSPGRRRGTQQLGAPSSGSACDSWWYPAAPGNRRLLRTAPSPRHQASRRRMRVPARHCAPRFPSIDGLETKIGRVHVSLPNLFPKGPFNHYLDNMRGGVVKKCLFLSTIRV